jgi:predicted nucleic acid-binding protein
MAWVVDTCIVLDLVLPASAWQASSANCLWRLAGEGVCVCPITFAELGPAFGGDPAVAEGFLATASINWREPWLEVDTAAAHRLWHQYRIQRQAGLAAKRPIADVLIAAFASRFQGIITRNAADFRQIDRNITIVEP